MQQNVLSQVAGSEQPQQEEVQLTELLPVKQSRIRENEIFKHMNTNADATDALKILQSFTTADSCYNNDEHELCSRNLSLCRKIEQIEQEKQEKDEKKWREDKLRKSIAEYDKQVIDSTEIRKEKERNNVRRFENESRTKNRKYKHFDKKSMIGCVVKSTKKRTVVRTVENIKDQRDEGNDDDGMKHRYKLGENAFLENERGNFLSENNGQVESTIYLDLDKNSELNDDVYIFRRELIDGEQGLKVNLRNVEQSYENEKSAKTTDGTLFNRIAIPCGTSIENNIDVAEKQFITTAEKNNTFGTKVTNPKLLLEDSANVSNVNFHITTMSYLAENKDNNNKVQDEENPTNTLFRPEASNSIVATKSTSSTLISTSMSSSSSSLSSSLLSSSTPPPYSKEENINGSECDRGKDQSTALHGMKTKQENQQKRYCCVVCEARFKGSGGLRNHYKIVHGAGPIFKCDECGKEFPLKERLKLHVRTHTGFKPYKCPECDKSFARGGQLVQHRRTHSQVKPYRCGLCSGTFTCAANLALHVKRHNGQKDHKCEICGRAFVRRDALKKHLECLHRDVKSFLCVICNKTFKGHLPQHMRTHARDRPHGCATCGQRFAQKSQLTVHQRTHSGQRPFRCLVCWQAFAHSTALKLHTRRHTGERPFKCAECNAGFTQLPHWKKHMKCIHGRNEPYACKKCTSFFRIKNDLECHEKTCHPESETEHDVPSTQTSDLITNTIMPASISMALQPTATLLSNEIISDKPLPSPSKYRIMTVERMRLLLAVLLKRISKQERLDELGFGKRLIDQVLYDSLISAGKDPVASNGLSELETLTKNLEIFLKWTVPKEHWEHFRKLNKTPEDILETLTAT